MVYDGAMGTSIQTRNPTLDDYWGKENCSEVLVLSRPDMIRDIHADFLRVGCDVVEMQHFRRDAPGAARVRPGDRVQEINRTAVKLAKDAARQFSTKDQTSLRGGLDWADDQAAVARAHWLR